MLPLFLVVLFISANIFCDPLFFLQEYRVEGYFNGEKDFVSDLQDLKNEKFIAISLGENCFPALHMREYGIRVRSFPFDWDIVSFAALYEILKNDFAGFIDLPNLAINQKENTVFNKKYQFKLNHDFEIADWLDGENGLAPRDERSLKKYQNVVDYYQRRITRFNAVFSLGVPIYFFRRVIRPYQARQLNDLLKSKYPESNYTLVCIEDENWGSPNEWDNMPANIIYVRLSCPMSHAFGVKNPEVGNIFKKIGLIAR